MRFDAILFDLDGTLLDTLADIADSMNAVLSSLGFPTHEADEYRYLVGDGVETLSRRALPDGSRSDELVQKCIGLMGVEYSRRWGKATRPYEGIPEFLGLLEARGIKRAVLSNKPDEFTKLMVEHYFRGSSFHAVRGARPSVPKKPDPFAALEIARGLDVLPSRTMFLGDTDTDMRTACNAGMYAVGVLWGFRGAEELLKNGARELVSRPDEVLGLL